MSYLNVNYYRDYIWTKLKLRSRNWYALIDTWRDVGSRFLNRFDGPFAFADVTLGTVWPDVGVKRCPIPSQVAQKVTTAAFTLKLMFITIKKKVSQHLDYFCKIICHQELSKIGQILSPANNIYLAEVWPEWAMFFLTKVVRIFNNFLGYFDLCTF